MNNELEEYARRRLKEGLAQLQESHRNLFKRMYSHNNLDADINDVVDQIPVDKLDFAMRQVANTKNQ